MRTVGTALLGLALLASCAGEEPARPSPAPPARSAASLQAQDSAASQIRTVGGLQAQRTEVDGIVADLLSATREEGRLVVTVRFRNAGSDSLSFSLPAEGGTYPGLRLTADGRSFPIARQDDGDPAAPQRFDAALAPGDSRLWRATFVAPPRDARTFDLQIPGVEPFTDVPITDEPTSSGP